MNLAEDIPCRFTINTHGGMTLQFSDFCICNTIGGEWAVQRKGDNGWLSIAKTPLDAFRNATQRAGLTA